MERNYHRATAGQDMNTAGLSRFLKYCILIGTDRNTHCVILIVCVTTLPLWVWMADRFLCENKTGGEKRRQVLKYRRETRFFFQQVV